MRLCFQNRTEICEAAGANFLDRLLFWTSLLELHKQSVGRMIEFLKGKSSVLKHYKHVKVTGWLSSFLKSSLEMSLLILLLQGLEAKIGFCRKLSFVWPKLNRDRSHMF